MTGEMTLAHAVSAEPRSSDHRVRRKKPDELSCFFVSLTSTCIASSLYPLLTHPHRNTPIQFSERQLPIIDISKKWSIYLCKNLPPSVFIALELPSLLYVAPELVSAMNNAAERRAPRSRLPKVEIELLIAWAAYAIKSGQEILEGLVFLLENIQKYKDALLSENKRQSAVLFRRLRLSMGFLPKSERNRQSGDLDGNKNVDGCHRLRSKTKVQRIKSEIARYEQLEE